MGRIISFNGDWYRKLPHDYPKKTKEELIFT